MPVSGKDPFFQASSADLSEGTAVPIARLRQLLRIVEKGPRERFMAIGTRQCRHVS